jgi:hypothetical protein
MTPQIIHWWLYGAHIILYYNVRSFIFTHEQLFFITWSVQASLRAPQLIPGPTEHHANPMGM